MALTGVGQNGIQINLVGADDALVGFTLDDEQSTRLQARLDALGIGASQYARQATMQRVTEEEQA